jgi:hypothetical protein
MTRDLNVRHIKTTYGLHDTFSLQNRTLLPKLELHILVIPVIHIKHKDGKRKWARLMSEASVQQLIFNWMADEDILVAILSSFGEQIHEENIAHKTEKNHMRLKQIEMF